MYYFVRRISEPKMDHLVTDTTAFSDLEAAYEYASCPAIRHGARTEVIKLNGRSIVIVQEFDAVFGSTAFSEVAA